MKSNLNIFVILIFSMAVLACNNKSKEQIILEEMHKEVMVIHDEVMPKITPLNRIARQLKEKLDSPDSIGQKGELEEAIKLLMDSDEIMKQWMYEFKKPDSLPFEEAKSYYEQELEKIKKVKDDILKSIENAEKLADS